MMAIVPPFATVSTAHMRACEATPMWTIRIDTNSVSHAVYANFACQVLRHSQPNATFFCVVFVPNVHHRNATRAITRPNTTKAI